MGLFGRGPGFGVGGGGVGGAGGGVGGAGGGGGEGAGPLPHVPEMWPDSLLLLVGVFAFRLHTPASSFESLVW